MDGIVYEHRLNIHDFVLPCHYENVYQILIILRGHITYTVENTDYDVKAGGIIILNSLESHYLHVLEYPYERILIRLDPSYFFDEVKSPDLMSMFIRRSKGFRHALSVSRTAFDDIMACVSNLESEYNGDGKLADLMVGAHIRRILVYIYRECSMHEEGLPAGAVTIVSRAMNYMNKNFTRTISLDEIANVSMVSKDHLSHIFSRTTGSGIKQYLINLRINHAKFLLCESDRNISEVAEACGYEDVNYFSRQFRNAEGMSPRDFRRMVHERPAYDNG